MRAKRVHGIHARTSYNRTILNHHSMPAERTTQCQPPPLRLAPVGDKTVELDFDGGHLSSDAGLVLLKDLDD